MGESFIEPASVTQDLFRGLFSFLDRGVYWLLTLVYQLFFNVASADLFANETIMNFYGRVQLIIGVFMMFQLAMTILKGIMNPDTFTDSKSGAGNLITRIITSLVLLTVLVPVNFGSPRNEYEMQINNNGLLFGTLYSLQHRILSNNTIGRLILGSDADSMDYLSSDSNENELKKSSRIFTATILKGFYRINLLPEGQRPKHEDGKDDAVFNDNRVCKDIDDELLSAYTRVDAEPGEILSMVTLTCNSDGTETFIERVANRFTSHFSGNDRYILAYIPFWSTLVGFIFVFILLSFTVDIAVRSVKLAVLRLIAPIPIISYMDPKGSKDNAFSSWVKVLSSTYLDLFIRLATVYFVIFIIQDICTNGLPILHSSGILGTMTAILIFIGLFVFAKQAPKFIKQVLGLKDDGGKLFGGFGDILAVGAAGLGTIGSAATGWRAAKEENAELHPNSRLNFARNAGSALLGGISGGIAGAGALLGKDASAKSVIQAQNQRNAMRAAHSTALGRLGSTGYGLFTGRSLSTKGNNIAKGAQDWVKAQGDWKTALEDEAKIQGGAFAFKDAAGNTLFNARYEEVERAVASAHDGKVTIAGVDYDANIFTKSIMDDNLKAQVRAYQAGGVGSFKSGGTSYADNIKAGGKLYKKRSDAFTKAKDVDVSGLQDAAVAQNFRNYDVDRIDTYGKAIGAANNVIANQQNDMRQRMRNANDQAKK